ncbi:MAG: exosome complex RNA-binding protein Csl4 [Candidatus Korarchaeum sp.]|nr:exosome complex RNA-binding protein Csl4 [Candidatus Korarchaeum sp.]MDW8035023.1 exosome complex RNA-binding protein Csl4 [Candidatus Korarchaeum sp.]
MRGSVVVPGERIGVVEEYIRGEGIFEVGGELFSSYLGFLDRKDLEVSVRPVRKPILPIRVGELVLGEIRSADRNNFNLFLTILLKPRISILVPPVHANMPKRASNLGARPSDLLIVKVENVENGVVTVTMEGSSELGVIRSICETCGSPLDRGVGYTLICRDCGRIYLDKKLSSKYGWNPFKEGLIKYVKERL